MPIHDSSVPGVHHHVVTLGHEDSITVYGAGTVPAGSGVGTGNDTISLGSGTDTIFQAGTATVSGTFGSATLSGGALQVLQSRSHAEENALGGKATLMGSAGAAEFTGGGGITDRVGVSGGDTLIAGSGSGSDTMDAGGSGKFGFLSTVTGGTHIVDNFVSTDSLKIQDYGARGGDIHHIGGNTVITLDGGHTKIELVGVTITPAEIKH